MFSKLPIVALAALSAVSASPLNRRQATSAVASAASSAVSSAVSGASSAVASATSAVESATSAASSGASSVASGASSAVANATSTASSAAATATGSTGNQSYPLYPCPTGFLLTYVEQNVTLDAPITQVGAVLGNWSASPIFPNVTEQQGGTEVGATHTLNLQGVNLTETLVNATTNATSGFAQWNWNLTNGPVSAMGVSVSNYSTVFAVYDPNFDTTGSIGNTTTAQIFVNFCASEQAAGSALVGALTQAELGALQAIVAQAGAQGGNQTSSAAPAPSSAASSAESATSSAASGASSATSAAASGASSVASGATSAAGAATSAIASAVAGATSAAAGAATSSA